ncbi:phospholipid scramblase 1-like [Littorina saxatilis]|uniref:Phospholipid scramblase n=1 Tax=Littorina saxatilis TaxID=31220 RepID=A0AAN9AIU7_9CAEN
MADQTFQMQKGYGTGPPPVIGQPGQSSGAPYAAGQTQWMPPVDPQPNCSPGMEYLTQLDQLLIQQETHLLEILAGWECKNKFKVLNSLGQQVYYAFEESSICQRMCCAQARGFVYHITDNMQQEIFRVRRDFKCCTGVFCCPGEGCYYYATVEDRNGQILGHVSNLTFCCTPLFGIFDESKNLIAEIRGPCCPCQMVCCTNDVDFPVIDTKDQSQIGTISKQWPGLLKEMFTDSDNFRVSFPINMDVKKKALMFGAIFIIDMMLYERNQNK